MIMKNIDKYKTLDSLNNIVVNILWLLWLQNNPGLKTKYGFGYSRFDKETKEVEERNEYNI